MSTKSVILSAAFLSTMLAPALGLCANTTYAFDTVTAVTMHRTTPSVSGIEKVTGNALTVSFVENTNEMFQFVVSRCLPLILTALEKPNRYYLTVVVDPALTNVQLTSCRLDVK